MRSSRSGQPATRGGPGASSATSPVPSYHHYRRSSRCPRAAPTEVLDSVFEVIVERQRTKPAGSYVADARARVRVSTASPRRSVKRLPRSSSPPRTASRAQVAHEVADPLVSYPGAVGRAGHDSGRCNNRPGPAARGGRRFAPPVRQWPEASGIGPPPSPSHGGRFFQRGAGGESDLTPGPFPAGKGSDGGAGPPLSSREAGAVWRTVAGSLDGGLRRNDEGLGAMNRAPYKKTYPCQSLAPPPAAMEGGNTLCPCRAGIP